MQPYNPGKSQETLWQRKFDKIPAWLAEDLSVVRKSAEQQFQGGYFPSRVIDLGLEAGRESPPSGHCDNRRLRLLDTREARRHRLHDGKVWVWYAALSHRWSMATESSSTTRANLEDRLSGFEASDLCQKFQDAVRVAREMKIPYLWIDSLCIVQIKPLKNLGGKV